MDDELSPVTEVKYGDETNLSRRSVDWRDSGIVIDEDHQFISFETLDKFNYSATTTTTSTTTNTTTATTKATTLHLQQQSRKPTSQGTCYSAQKLPLPNHKDADGDTLLHLATVGLTLDKVKDLIKLCDLNATNNMLQTPLHVAVQANRPEVVEMLIFSGARLDVQDRRGNTPIHLASSKGHKEIVEIILDAAIARNKSPIEAIKYFETTNFDGLTCLHLAAENDRRDIIEILVNKYHVNVNCHDSKSGETIMHKAISKLNSDLVKFLLKLSKHCNEPDYSNREPLDTIRKLSDSRLNREQANKLRLIEQLVNERIHECIGQGGCCLNSETYRRMSNEPDGIIRPGSSSSSSSSSSEYTSDESDNDSEVMVS